jgi:serine/threonine protein kinase
MLGAITHQSAIDITKLNEIGQGAEGRVFEFIDDPTTVYKEYFLSSQSPPNLRALQDLADLPAKWERADQAWINTRTAWPQSSVVDHGRLRGYLMKRIPDTFSFTHGLAKRPKQVLCDWNYLSMRNRYSNNTKLVSEIPQPSIPQVVELIVDLSKTLEILHRHDVVVGDISGRNIIWTNDPTWRIMLIDCDGFRVRGSTGVNFAKQTPDWEDPEVTQLRTTRQSDIYKLGLAAYRSVWAATTDRPPRGLHSARVPQGAPNQIHSLISRSISPTGRPSASDWVHELTATPPSPGTPYSPSPNRQAERKPQQSRNRPVIPMTKGDSKDPGD